MHVMVAGVPSASRRIDPPAEVERYLGGPLDREDTGFGDVLWSARDRDRKATAGQIDRVPVGSIDLILERQIGSETLQPVRIHALAIVADEKRRGGRAPVLVAHTQLDRMRRGRAKHDPDLIPEPDVLGPLTDVEAQDRRSLPRVAAVDLQHRVLDGKAPEA